jgi:type IV pilus assembly protein PilB
MTDVVGASGRGEYPGYEFVDLAEAELAMHIVQQVPASLCRRHNVIPYEERGNSLVLAMVDPANIFAIDDVGSVTGRRIIPVATSEASMQYAQARYLRSDDELEALQSELADEHAVVEAQVEVEDAAGPIIKFVNLLIEQAIHDRASDIHIEPGARDVKVRFRIDGVLKEMQVADASLKNGIVSRLKIMSDIDIAERRKPQDGRMSVVHHGRTVDLRVATLPTVWGEKVVLRILDHSATELKLSDLAMSEINANRFREAIARPHGMMLVTGPTGSGKSTTLYTAVSHVSSPQINVITVEDPVEFRLAGISQVQINARCRIDFRERVAIHSAIRSRCCSGRRDSRSRDRCDLRGSFVDRSLGALHHAHERCAQRHDATHRDRCRAVSRRYSCHLRCCPTSGASSVLAMQRGIHRRLGAPQGRQCAGRR